MQDAVGPGHRLGPPRVGEQVGLVERQPVGRVDLPPHRRPHLGLAVQRADGRAHAMTAPQQRDDRPPGQVARPAGDQHGDTDVPDEVCRTVGSVLGRVGDKWSVLVMVLLAERSRRFSELRREIGTVSQRMLTVTFRGLERDGYLTRTVTPSFPPRTDHALMEMGRDVLVPLDALALWALARHEQVLAARRAYDARESTLPLSRARRALVRPAARSRPPYAGPARIGATPAAGPLAQSAEQRTFNPRVVGSSPTGPTNDLVSAHLRPRSPPQASVEVSIGLKWLALIVHSRRRTARSYVIGGVVAAVARL